MKRFGAGLVVTVFVVFAIATQARAISLATSFKAPLTTPYVACGSETSTTDCTSGSMELDSPWTFSAGTIEIDDDEVSLRLDNIQLRDGVDCDTEMGSTACGCWDSNSGNCGTDADCTTPDECGPAANGATDNNYFVVHLYMQDLYEYFGTTKIRRDVNCHPTINFDLTHQTGNRNRQVNQTVSISVDSCGVFSEAHGVEIRHVEVKDKWGNMVAKTSL
jgi:hypothetical protein